MAWIELHQSLWTHRKTLIVAALLDLDETYAAAHLARLWTWALDNAPEGDVSRLPARVLAFGAGWKGDAQAFVDALIEAGWLERDGDTLRLHDWEQYAGRLIEKRRTEAERLRRYRQANKDETPTPPQRTPYVPRTNVVTVPNRTVPNQDRTGEESKDSGVVVVIPAPNGATTTTARSRETIPFQQLSPGAQEVVTGWREAFGKRAPPKLNPTQVAKLEAAVADLGIARLLEAADWCAGKGLSEFAKTLSAAYTKRQRDEGQEYRNGTGYHRNGTRTVDSVDALAKYDG